MSGLIFIISAASGTGKTSLAKALAESLPDIKISVSHTTRPMRQGEMANASYFFITEDEFQNMVASGMFLEQAKVFGFSYGTSKKWVLEQIQAGIDVILDIDWQGARMVRQLMPEATISLFLLPPSVAALSERLAMRNRDSNAIMADRLNKASSEIAHYNEFDYLIINDNFAKALHEMQCIIKAHRLRCSRQAIKHARLLADLMQKV